MGTEEERVGEDVARTKGMRLRLMPAPKTRWSWRGIRYSSSDSVMVVDVVVVVLRRGPLCQAWSCFPAGLGEMYLMMEGDKDGFSSGQVIPCTVSFDPLSPSAEISLTMLTHKTL